MVSTVLKKRFCKDNEYPINIYRIHTFLKGLNSLVSAKSGKSMLKQLNNSEEKINFLNIAI